MHKPFLLLSRLISAFSIFLFFMFFANNNSFALSSVTQQMSSNLFVDIAKKLNPAVVNVSTQSKTEKE